LSDFLRLQALRCFNATSVIWAPAWEEIIFRFAVFYLVAQRSGGNLPFGALASALLFAALHFGNIFQSPSALSIAQLVVSLAVGLFLSAHFARSGSLFDVLAVHAFNNLSAILWMSLEVSSTDAGGAGRGCAGSLPTELSTPLALSLMLQCVIYGALGAAEMRGLIERPITASGMRKIHPLLQHSMVTVPAVASSTTTSSGVQGTLSLS
jgi:hypothetical protein